MISDLRWDAVTGKAERPDDQDVVDRLRDVLRRKDPVEMKAFYEEMGEPWDNGPFRHHGETERSSDSLCLHDG